MAERDASPLVNGVFFGPLDFVSCVRRVLRSIRPSLLLVLETEIWPNLFYEAKLAGAKVVVLNGRISDRTWPRYRRWKSLFAPILGLPDFVVVQSHEDSARYLELGVPPANLRIEANLKYDTTAASAPLGIETYGARQIWVAASTVGPNEKGSLVAHQIDEDDLVLDAFVQLSAELPELLLILAPRQPGRFDDVAEKLRVRNLHFRRRSGKGESELGLLRLPGVLLLDTMGELARIYGLADVVFVGGSLAPRGGHNIVEPAAAGAPVVIGPHMQNFASITSDFLGANAVIQIAEPRSLLPAVRGLLLDRELASAIGERALAVVRQKTGVSSRIVEDVLPTQMLGHYARPKSLSVRLILSGLAYLWRRGGAVKRRRSEGYASTVQPLGAPVISIGGVAVGGSGKTPFTNYLTRKLSDQGWSPAILTRGYRRRSKDLLALPPGARLTAAHTGDEAQIFLRDGCAPVGIGGNRYDVARLVETKFPRTDLFVLDDGFQHALLKRDVDVVLIDGLDPLGGNEVVPLGRLREPPEALRRATIFVVTRCESNPRFHAISELLKSFNDKAPCFRARVRPVGWRGLDGRQVTDLPGSKVAAFCGLGNPLSFWRTLDSLGLEVVLRRTFRDHHRYTLNELISLAGEAQLRSADCLVTTEKDWINLRPAAEPSFGSSRLFWLEIALELEDETEFFSILKTQLAAASQYLPSR